MKTNAYKFYWEGNFNWARGKAIKYHHLIALPPGNLSLGLWLELLQWAWSIHLISQTTSYFQIKVKMGRAKVGEVHRRRCQEKAFTKICCQSLQFWSESQCYINVSSFGNCSRCIAAFFKRIIYHSPSAHTSFSCSVVDSPLVCADKFTSQAHTHSALQIQGFLQSQRAPSGRQSSAKKFRRVEARGGKLQPTRHGYWGWKLMDKFPRYPSLRR